MESKKLKQQSIKEQFNQGPESEQKKTMTKEETIKHLDENLPFMRMQDEYDRLAFAFAERKVSYLELQVRELEAIGYLSQWKAGQDEANRIHEQEEKMKAEWDAMTPEQQDEYRKQAQANIAEIEKQAKEATAATADSSTHTMD
jgi:hypothetical protein